MVYLYHGIHWIFKNRPEELILSSNSFQKILSEPFQIQHAAVFRYGIVDHSLMVRAHSVDIDTS